MYGGKLIHSAEGIMSIKDELLFDFSIRMPRLLIGGKTGILDNVKKIVLISENNIYISPGNRIADKAPLHKLLQRHVRNVQSSLLLMSHTLYS